MIELHCKFGGQTPSASIFLAIFLHLRVGFWGVKMSPGGGVGFEGAKWHGRSLSYVPFDPSFSLRSNRQPPVARAPCENKGHREWPEICTVSLHSSTVELL